MKKKRSGVNLNLYAYIFMAPLIIGILVFMIYPVLYTFYLSVTDKVILNKDSGNFVGMSNFTRLLSDKFFRGSIGNTWKIWLTNFIPQLGIALLFSVWFTSVKLKIKAVGAWRTIFYMPNLLMPATVAVLFNMLLGMPSGPMNQFLVRSGLLNEAFNFARSAPFMQGTVAYIQWWMWFGSTIIILTAGMTSISPTLYESAVIDGASSGAMFFKITLPLLKPIMLYTLVTSMVGGMQMFDIPMLLTDGKGSPENSIATLNVTMYKYFSSSQGHIGIAASVGVFIFIMTTIVALLLFGLLGERDDTPKEKKKKGKGAVRNVA